MERFTGFVAKLLIARLPSSMRPHPQERAPGPSSPDAPIQKPPPPERTAPTAPVIGNFLPAARPDRLRKALQNGPRPHRGGTMPRRRGPPAAPQGGQAVEKTDMAQHRRQISVLQPAGKGEGVLLFPGQLAAVLSQLLQKLNHPGGHRVGGLPRRPAQPVPCLLRLLGAQGQGGPNHRRLTLPPVQGQGMAPQFLLQPACQGLSLRQGALLGGGGGHPQQRLRPGIGQHLGRDILLFLQGLGHLLRLLQGGVSVAHHLIDPVPLQQVARRPRARSGRLDPGLNGILLLGQHHQVYLHGLEGHVLGHRLLDFRGLVQIHRQCLNGGPGQEHEGHQRRPGEQRQPRRRTGPPPLYVYPPPYMLSRHAATPFKPSPPNRSRRCPASPRLRLPEIPSPSPRLGAAPGPPPPLQRICPLRAGIALRPALWYDRGSEGRRVYDPPTPGYRPRMGGL